jgi:hypothetical protein
MLGASGASAGPGFTLVSFAQYPEGDDNPKRAKGYRFNPLRLAVGRIGNKTRSSA